MHLMPMPIVARYGTRLDALIVPRSAMVVRTVAADDVHEMLNVFVAQHHKRYTATAASVENRHQKIANTPNLQIHQKYRTIPLVSIKSGHICFDFVFVSNEASSAMHFFYLYSLELFPNRPRDIVSLNEMPR